MCRHCASRQIMSFVHGSVTCHICSSDLPLADLYDIGTRWLTRWDKEVDLVTKLIYYGITVGRGTLSISISCDGLYFCAGNQTLGEEYTDVWQYSSFGDRTPPSDRIRSALIILSTFPSYILAKWAASPTLNMKYPKIAKCMKTLPLFINVATEVNLVVFYLKGTYYDLSKRLLGVQHVTFSTSCPVFIPLRILAVVLYTRGPACPSTILFTFGCIAGHPPPPSAGIPYPGSGGGGTSIWQR